MTAARTHGFKTVTRSFAAAESNMAFLDLDARLHDLASQFHDDILAQLRHAGDHPQDGHARVEEQQTPDS